MVDGWKCDNESFHKDDFSRACQILIKIVIFPQDIPKIAPNFKGKSFATKIPIPYNHPSKSPNNSINGKIFSNFNSQSKSRNKVK